MPHDQEHIITLTIAGEPVNVPVTHFNGHEGLNEPFRFDLELDPLYVPSLLDQALHQDAFLRLDRKDAGIHGIVQSIRVRHLGAEPSLYRLVLVARLQRLECRVRTRSFTHLSVPEIIRQLLEENQISASHYRFELDQGFYPARALCVQYGESDLQLLQRLCEEEGIHYHFEHCPQRHVVVIADDPGSFLELSAPMAYHRDCRTLPEHPCINQLFECHSPLCAQDTRSPHPAPPSTVGSTDDGAANHSAIGHPPPWTDIDPQQQWQHQFSRRTLERLRCAQRRIYGQSNLARLCTGRILQVQSHPLPSFNDQWLITEIHHTSGQPASIPELCEAVADKTAPWWQEANLLDHEFVPAGPMATGSQGYRNRFTAIPWVTSFRPALRHEKPKASGYQIGTLLGHVGLPAERDAEGRVLVRLLWETKPVEISTDCWLPMTEPAARHPGEPTAAHLAGSRVLVGFIDNDPDLPVVCGVLSSPAESVEKLSHALLLQLDGQPLAPDSNTVQIDPGQRLDITTDSALTLSANGSQIQLTPDSITLVGPLTDLARPSEPRSSTVDWPGEIHLYAYPSEEGQVVANCIWYIARMSRPGLEELARVNQANILHEGISDALGKLRLRPFQKQQLAEQFATTPTQLYLLYPGQCIALHDYFQQHWTEEQRWALLRAGLTASPNAQPRELNTLYEWLRNTRDQG